VSSSIGSSYVAVHYWHVPVPYADGTHSTQGLSLKYTNEIIMNSPWQHDILCTVRCNFPTLPTTTHATPQTVQMSSETVEGEQEKWSHHISRD